MRLNKEHQQNDIDLILKDKFLEQTSTEVKVRNKLYSDIVLETKSNMEYNTLGNLYKSKATILAYVNK